MSNTIIMFENGKAVGGEGHPTNADEITFDNTGSSLTASNVQGAIDEVVAEIANASLKRAVVSGTTDALGNLTTAIPINNANIIGARYGSAQNGGVIPMISPVSDVWYFKCLDERMQEVANSNVIVYYWYIQNSLQ